MSELGPVNDKPVEIELSPDTTVTLDDAYQSGFITGAMWAAVYYGGDAPFGFHDIREAAEKKVAPGDADWPDSYGGDDED